MNRTKIDTLIVYLVAIKNYAKDIHYNCSGQDFYGKHLFADRIAKNLDEYIDQLKEVCLLSHYFTPLDSYKYLQMAINLLPKGVYDFRILQDLLHDALVVIENFEISSKGNENLIGTIAQDLQNNFGLLSIMFRSAEE